jgi:predicted RNase H-like nuclease
MTMLCGVDGCPAGWVAVWRDHPDNRPKTAVFSDIRSLIADIPQSAIIAVDMPIGLPDFVTGGGRGPEKAVRPFLAERQSSVFSVPSRTAVYAECGPFSGQGAMIQAHKRANKVALETSDPPRKISIQAFNLFPKIRQIDALLREWPDLTSRVFESHPEFAFARLNGGSPMKLPKKIKGKVNPSGMDERKDLLASHGLPRQILDQPPPKGAAADDFLDACAMFLIAGRIARGEASPHPAPLQQDSHGIPVAIWA